MIEQEIMKQIKKDGILHKHNYDPYINLEKYYNLYDKFCIVHATGTGKSYLSIQLMYDILRKKEDSKFLYTVPANNIKKQIVDEINQLPLANEEREKIKRSIEFITYQALSSKNEEELKNYDLCIVDEFQHLGADKWSRNIKKMEERGIKILGLSATPIREEYTSTPENVAETFFDGNVASYYDIVDAWIDKVLPVPIYKASKIELLERCEELKNKVDSSNVSEEEREKVYRAYNKIKTEIKEEHKMPEDIIRNNIKKDGKYIYFCSTIQDLMESKESFLNILTEDEKQNVEIYEIYSGYKEKENNEAHYNFVNNKTKNKEDANKKLRVMFSIDMYTEGVHIKDVDGVIMGRGTKSYRVFNQQIGRALGVKTDKTTNPLIIDLAGNIYGMRNLLRKLDERIEERKRKGKLKEEDLDINLKYILTEEEIEVLNSFEKMSKYIRSILDIDMPIKIEEFIEKVDEEGFIAPGSGEKVQSTDHINNVGQFWGLHKEKIYKCINQNENMQKKFPVA
ncbi:MAG: DEAD/DEAH box helicase family protein, partial [Tenericutes bacterium]|nr:DEAD/DEAH box helicase family protein [Mycoplasmatota bacterium]